ncbi:MAG: preprotein translocase subunit YajC [Gemmatimonadales bacterium]|jgi:preprotein translocase subunit YajC
MIPLGIHPALLALQLGGGAGSFTPLIVQGAAILAIFYFLLIRPQQKQRREHEETLRNLKRGDQVVTTGGIVGEVIHVRETVTDEGGKARPLEDHITIKSAESRLIVERGRIARIIGSAGSAQTKG